MAGAVRRNGGVVEVKVYENEGHGFARRENDIDAFGAQQHSQNPRLGTLGRPFG